jgi:hypothetical protein
VPVGDIIQESRAALSRYTRAASSESATTRPLLPQHDGTALILANDVERDLADIDADDGGRSVEFL